MASMNLSELSLMVQFPSESRMMTGISSETASPSYASDGAVDTIPNLSSESAFWFPLTSS